jgi:Spy/CpxP family protein refolding chaperone
MPHGPAHLSLPAFRIRSSVNQDSLLVVLYSDGSNQGESISNESKSRTHEVKTQRLLKKEAFMMLTKRNIGLVIGLMFVVGSVAVPVRAQQMRHHGRGGSLSLLMRAAQLTPDQKTQVRSIMQANRSTFRDIFSQLSPLRQKLNSQLFSRGTADPTLLNQINSLRGQLEQARLNVFQQIWQLLNSAQQSQVASVYSQLQASNAQRRSMWQSLQQTPTR